MDKKTWILVLIVVLAVIVVFLFFPKKETVIEEDIPFSNFPPDWIEELEELTPDNKNIEINVIEATEGRAEFIVDQERYIDVDGEIISLFYGGSYQGEVFSNIYRDEAGNMKMLIWDNMNPNDGVIEGFGLFKKENDAFVIYLFVDEDWKQQSNGNINIIWGNNITDKENLNAKTFDFSTEEKGIYIDKITKDVSWFVDQNPVVGRLFFGEISLADVQAGNYQRTFVALT